LFDSFSRNVPDSIGHAGLLGKDLLAQTSKLASDALANAVGRFGLMANRPHPRGDETNGDKNRAEPFTARPSPNPQEVLVYATSWRTRAGDLFVQPGCRAHGFDFFGGDEGCSTAIGIHTGLGAIM
jgi:hypothetical protein